MKEVDVVGGSGFLDLLDEDLAAGEELRGEVLASASGVDPGAEGDGEIKEGLNGKGA